jgi:hypothetical protein
MHDAPSRRSSWRQRGAALARAYRGLGLLVLNTILLLLIVNAALYLPTRSVEPSGATLRLPGIVVPPPRADLEAVARQATEIRALAAKERLYPSLTSHEVATMWLETLAVHAGLFAYEPYTGFRVKSYRGRFVNVDEDGFRWGARPAPWPPESSAFNVFVFGGSTTFGYGVPDDATIPAALERALQSRLPDRRVHVYNFGRGYYFSTQERVLFERLLGDGHRPDVAVFVDGLNDFFNLTGEPENTALLARCFETATPNALATVVGDLPMGRAARWLRERSLGPSVEDVPTPHGDGDAPVLGHRRRRHLRRVVMRVVRNHRLAAGSAAAFGVEPLFVWQPVPMHDAEHLQNPYAVRDYGRHEHARAGYALMADLAGRGKLGPRFTWCADVHQRATEGLYVDSVHYSPAMSTLIAACIADGLTRGGALPR